MFALLLRHLTALGIQQISRSDEAVLAVDILFVRPDTDVQFNAPSDPKSRQVALVSGPIEDFLTSEHGREVETLVRLGVPRAAVASVQMSDGAVDRAKERVFTAGSSPIAALEGYEEAVNSSLQVEEWQTRFGKRALTDLRNLGLVDLENGTVVPTHADVTNPEGNFRHSAAKSGTISTVRAMLLKEANASADDIIDVIAIKYGKSYSSRASKLRVGNALKRWARWLEPHLIDPQGGSGAEMLRASATSKKRGVGQRSLRTPENLQIVREGLAKGLPMTKIAAQMGLSAETVRGWRRRGYLDEG